MKHLGKAVTLLMLATLILAGMLLLASCGPECSHIYLNPTCTEPKTCMLCGATEGEPAGHSGGTATCLERAVCIVCNEEYGELGPHKPVADDGDCTTPVDCARCDEYAVEAAEHTFSHDCDTKCDNKGCRYTRTITHHYTEEVAEEKYRKTAATCTAQAVYYTSCQCGAYSKTESMVFSYGELLPHEYTREVASGAHLKSAATCTELATYYKSCRCGIHDEEKSGTFTAGNLLPHKYTCEVASATYLKTAATCTELATYYKSCTCGAHDAAGPSFAYGELAPHAYTVSSATADHRVTEATCTALATYYKSCVCGIHDEKESAIFAFGDLLPHTYTEAVVAEAHLAAAATCTAPAAYYHSCSECGANDVEGETFSHGDPVPHTEGEAVRENEVAATCGDDGSYDSVVYCATCKTHELSRVTVTLPATGNHTPAADDGDCTTDTLCTVCGKVAVEGFAHKAGTAVHENVTAPTCGEDGHRDVCVYCSVCSTEMSRVTEAIPATGDHEGAAPVVENRKEPTCGVAGSYENVTYCSECDSELRRDTVAIPATGNHTPAAAVAENRKEPTCALDGSYDSVVYCSVCGHELSRETLAIPATGDHVYTQKTVRDTYLATAATCTEKATYYMSCGCGAHDPEKSPTFAYGNTTPHSYTHKVAERTFLATAATCTKQATYYKSCVCGAYSPALSATFASGSPLPHEYTEKVATYKYLATYATCTEKATYYMSCACGAHDTEESPTFASGSLADHRYNKEVVDEKYLFEAATCTHAARYYYSCVCGEFSVYHSTTFDHGEKLPHTQAAPVTENEVEPTCSVAGSYDLVVRCATCYDHVFSRQTFTLSPTGNHTKGDAVTENNVAPTCKENGHYDEVYYCTVCGAEAARKTVTVPATGVCVQSTEPTVENKVESSCTVKGSYDEVYSCIHCGEEMLRLSKELPLADHEGVETVIKEATCLEKGEKRVTCKNCDYVGLVTIPRHRAHSYQDGLCTVCGIPEKTTAVSVSGNKITGIDAASVAASGGIVRLPEVYNGTYVTEIDASAFAGNPDIKAIYLTANIKSLPNSVFENCTGLEKVVFAEGLTSIGNYAFRGCTSLREIVLPDTLTRIGTQAFYGSAAVTRIVIGEGVTSIGTQAFAGCVNLKTVEYNAKNCLTVSENTFASGGRDVGGFDIVIGTRVEAIPGSLFYFNKTGTSYAGELSVIKSITFREGGVCTSIGKYAFASPFAKGMTVYLPATVQTVSDYAFRGSTDWSDSTNHYFYRRPVMILSAAEKKPSGFTSFWASSGAYFYNGTSFTFENPYLFGATGVHGVTEDGYYWAEKGDGTLVIYDVDDSVTEVVFPETIGGKTVTEIAVGTLYYHKTVTSIVIPKGITKIGKQAFAFCDALTRVEFDAVACADLEGSAFFTVNNAGYVEILFVIDKDVTRIPSYFLTTANNYNAKFKKTVVFEKGSVCTEIADYAFTGGAFTSVVIPASVATVEYNGFGDFNSKIYYEGTAADWAAIEMKGSNTFTYSRFYYYVEGEPTAHGTWWSYGEDGMPCEVAYAPAPGSAGYASAGLTYKLSSDGTYYILSSADSATDTEIYIAESFNGLPVCEIASNVFRARADITAVHFPAGLKSIGMYAFQDCTALASVTLPSGLTTLSDSVFYGCTALSEVSLGSSLETMGNSVFYKCTSLSEITLPATLETVGGTAFAYTQLSEISLPASLRGIGSTAFDNTPIVEDPANWDMENMLFYVDTCLMSVNPAVEGEITVRPGTTVITYSAFYTCSKVTKITLPEGLLHIAANAFIYCSGLQTINLPDSLLTIGNGAFYNCSSLTGHFDLPACDVPAQLFMYCSKVEGVTIPEGVTSIGDEAFLFCYQLGNVTLPTTLKTIGEQAFYNCYAFTELTVPEGVTSIGASALHGLTSLKKLYLPSTLTSLEAGALGSMAELEEITVPFVGLSPRPSGQSANFGRIFTQSNTYEEGETVAQQYKRGNTVTTAYYYIPAGLKSITVHGGEINDYAFYGMSMVETLTLGDGLTMISGSSYLSSTAHYKNEANWTDGALYIGKYLIKVKSDVAGEFTVREGTLGIAGSAFSGCTGLTSVTLPASLTFIGRNAFSGCTALTAVSFGAPAAWRGYNPTTYMSYTLTPEDVADAAAMATFLTTSGQSGAYYTRQ